MTAIFFVLELKHGMKLNVLNRLTKESLSINVYLHVGDNINFHHGQIWPFWDDIYEDVLREHTFHVTDMSHNAI